MELIKFWRAMFPKQKRIAPSQEMIELQMHMITEKISLSSLKTADSSLLKGFTYDDWKYIPLPDNTPTIKYD